MKTKQWANPMRHNKILSIYSEDQANMNSEKYDYLLG